MAIFGVGAEKVGKVFTDAAAHEITVVVFI